MVRTYSVGSALLVAASTITLSNADYFEYTIRVRNLTYMQPFSPIFFVAHTKDVSIFKEGLPSSDAMKHLSEDGDYYGLEELVHEIMAPNVCGYVTGSDVQLPGQTEWYTLRVDDEVCDDSIVISMASMLVNTNDAFVGFDSETLKTAGSSKLFPIA